MSRDWVARAVAQGYGHLVIRDQVIEECARAVMPFDPSGEVAKAIRALKDKP